MLAKLLSHTLLSCALIACVLFIVAGTVRWPGAWVFLAEIATGSLTLGLWFASADPALLEERLRPPVQRAQKAWDKILLATLIAGFII